MNSSFKIISVIAGLLLLLLHFGLVILQQLPDVTGKQKLAYAVRGYAFFFHQNWNLFVPPPAKNYRLFVTFENNGFQKKEVFTDILTRHQSNRLAGYGPLVVAFSNSIHYFENNTPLKAALNGPVANDINFTILEEAVKNYLNHTYALNIRQPKLILFTEETETKTQRVYFN